MTAEEFAEKWGWKFTPSNDDIEWNNHSVECLSDLRSMILGQLMDFRDCHNRTHFAVIDIDEIDEFMNENWIE